MSHVTCESCGWWGYSDELVSLISIAGPGLISLSVDTPGCLCPQCADYHIFYKPSGENMDCHIEQQSDEYFCSTCGMRWEVGNEAPPCERGTIKRCILLIETTGRITGNEKTQYDKLKQRLAELDK